MTTLQRVADKESAISNGKEFKEKEPNGGLYILKKVLPRLFILIVIIILIAVAIGFIPNGIGEWAPWLFILLSLIIICYKPVKWYTYFTSTCPYYEIPISKMDAYQDKELLNKCWNKVNDEANVKWDESHDVFDQIAEGFCAFASMNSVLSSIYKQRLYLQYPPLPRPLTLEAIKNILTENIVKDERVINDFPNIKIHSIDIVIMDPMIIKLNDFEKMIKDIDVINELQDETGNKWQVITYYICNFCRAPLFFCNYPTMKRFWKFIAGGHFSPIISYCYDDNNIMYILIADVNRSYNDYLVRSDRLYEGMAAKQISSKRRGLLKIVVHRKIL